MRKNEHYAIQRVKECYEALSHHYGKAAAVEVVAKLEGVKRHVVEEYVTCESAKAEAVREIRIDPFGTAPGAGSLAEVPADK